MQQAIVLPVLEMMVASRFGISPLEPVMIHSPQIGLRFDVWHGIRLSPGWQAAVKRETSQFLMEKRERVNGCCEDIPTLSGLLPGIQQGPNWRAVPTTAQYASGMLKQEPVLEFFEDI